MVYKGINFGKYRRFERASLVPFVYGNTPEDVEFALAQAALADYGYVCPQRSSRLENLEGVRPGAAMKEGLLYLSIYTPSVEAPSEPLPVMVWIHGGAFLTGGSEEHRYSAQEMADSGNVIVVKLSYRLGALGFLYVPGIGAVNLGLGDLELGLTWINRYISIFGGDPGNVTLFGQSAGALSIAALLADNDLGSDHHEALERKAGHVCGGGPGAAGSGAVPGVGTGPRSARPLFQKAILQSPPLGIMRSEKEALELAGAFKLALGKDLFEASVEDILSAQDSVKNTFRGMSFMPVGCDYSPKIQGVEVVVGYTSEDASPFVRHTLGKLWGTALGSALIHAVTRKIFSKPAERYLQTLEKAGYQTHKYFLKWHPEGNPYGSCHCIELPFLLGNYSDWKDSAMLEGMTEDVYKKNRAIFLKTWTDFAWGKTSFDDLSRI